MAQYVLGKGSHQASTDARIRGVRRRAQPPQRLSIQWHRMLHLGSM